MQLALPVSVKFLHKGNRELSRNVASYLSMAAIENAELLAPHIQVLFEATSDKCYKTATLIYLMIVSETTFQKFTPAHYFKNPITLFFYLLLVRFKFSLETPSQANSSLELLIIFCI
jgi:hypothetical protein